MDELERVERRRALTLVVLVVLAVGLLAGYLLVPRTLVSGEVEDESWRAWVLPADPRGGVRISLSDELVAETPQVDRSTRLEDTEVVWIGPPETGETLVVGPTPREVDSIRVTTEQGGFTEAEVRRVAWRRFHVQRLPGHASVTDLVAVGPDGRILGTGFEPLVPAPTTSADVGLVAGDR